MINDSVINTDGVDILVPDDQESDRSTTGKADKIDQALDTISEGDIDEEYAAQEKRRKHLTELLESHWKRFLHWYLCTGAVSAWVAIVAVGLWSQIGYGATMFEVVISQESWLDSLRMVGMGIMFVLYMLDFFTAPHLATPGKATPMFIMGQRGYSSFGTLCARGAFVFSFCLGIAWCFLAAKTRPHYPVTCTLTLFVFLQIALRMSLKTDVVSADEIDELKQVSKKKRDEKVHMILSSYLEEQIDTLNYYKAVACSTLAAAATVACYWLIWAFISPVETWPQAQEDIASSGLDHTVVDNEQLLFNIQFNIWVAPIYVAVGYLLFFCMFLMRVYLHVTYTRTDELLTEMSEIFLSTDTNAAKEVMGVEHLDKLVDIVKMFCSGFVALGLGFWVTAKIGVGAANTALDVSGSIKTFLFAFTVCYSLFLALSLQRIYTQMVTEMWRNPFLKLMVEMIQSDWLKGIFVLLFWWMPPCYFVLAAMNKAVRRLRGIRDERDYDAETESGGQTKFLPRTWKKFVTKRASSQLAVIMDWNHTNLIWWAMCWGVMIWLLNVGCMVGLNVFLLWLNSWLPKNPWLAVLIWYVLGLLCFLNPFIPGPPVYLFGGLVCVDSFKQNAEDPKTGFWFGLVFMCFAAWILKLNACAMQQKGIGEPLGNKKWVQQLCGVHRPMIRAIEVVLRQPGLSYGKCAILCGGPDWPTSVLCGILRCNLGQIMYGTAPILFFVIPTVCTGAFKREEDEIFSTLTSLLLMVSVVMGCSFGVAAAFATQEVLDNHGPLLQVPMEKNKDLDWLDYISDKQGEIYTKVTEWKNLSPFLKFTGLLGFLMMSAQSYLFYMKFGDCFGDTERALTSNEIKTTWNKSEESENIILIVTDLGIQGNVMFLVGTMVFVFWAKRLNSLAGSQMAAVLDNIDQEREAWEMDQVKKRDELEEEMMKFYPEDYEIYLLQTGRPPKEGYVVDDGWEETEEADRGLRQRNPGESGDST